MLPACVKFFQQVLPVLRSRPRGAAVTKAVPTTYLTDDELNQFANIKLAEASEVIDGPQRDRVLAEAKALQRLAMLRKALIPRNSDAPK
jgi:hypothetical protein